MKKIMLIITAVFSLAMALPAASAQDVDLNKGPLNVFRRDSLQCGKGWKLTGLIWGDRPISACIYKPRKKNVFGGDF